MAGVDERRVPMKAIFESVHSLDVDPSVLRRADPSFHSRHQFVSGIIASPAGLR